MSQTILAQRCNFKERDVIDRQYCVEKELGEGAFGKVFRVRKFNNDTYALKLLKLWEVHPDIRKQLVDRFDMEFETGQIDSNYLVHSVAHGMVEGNPYIVMEYCPGGDLIGCMRRKNVDWVKIAHQVLYGLRALHQCGKVHRDLKPENVLLNKSGTAVLTDFGISGDRNKRMTERNILGKPRQIFGTYAYMPPEQVKRNRGDATVLPTTDIFSFGVMMYQLLTGGNLPFGNLENENDLVVYLQNGERGIWDRTALHSSKWNNVLEGCLEPDFKRRLQSVDTVLELLPAGAFVEEEQLTDRQHRLHMIVRHGFLLRIMQGEEYGKEYRLPELLDRVGKRRLTLGRDEHNIIRIKEEESLYISRRHCNLEQEEEHWFIRDGQWIPETRQWRGSLNGTYVNSTPVSSEGMEFHPGDIISIGDVKLRVEGY